MSIQCVSRISDVVVHARGALVTRRVELPTVLPDEEVDLVVPEVTVIADPGSVRATLRGGARQVVAVATALHVPDERAAPGPSVAALRELVHRRARLRDEQARLAAQRDRLIATILEPELENAVARVHNLGEERDKIESRVGDALAAHAMLGELTTALDTRLAALDETLRELERAIDAAGLADLQASSAARMGTGHPTRRIAVRLAGVGPVDGLDLTYVVPAARWWPTYTLRIAEATGAEWWLEAIVAQLGGEDWRGVNLSLSTADLVHDARLPELASRRLGRTQARPRKAYRPPPTGLDAMFAGYDRVFPNMPAPPPPPPVGGALAQPLDGIFATADEVSSPAVTGSFRAEEEELSADVAYAPPPQAKRSRAAPPAKTMMFAATAPAPRPEAQAAPRGGAAAAMGARAAKPTASAPPPEPAPLEPADSWLDFDALALAPAHDRGHRGRLIMTPGGDAGRRADAARRIEALAPAGGVRDPALSRGQFDHVYAAAGGVDVPADGITHRVAIGVGRGAPTLRYRTVPREAAEVYKEAELKNPFTTPLLAGPVDVYVEGSLLVTTAIDWIDAGGPMAVGLGVEDRLRVARNARVTEDTAGLLGGQVVVNHTVTVDLSSSLASAVRVEVLDRMPVTDEKDLKIELTASRPEAKPYKQTERGAPVRRGLSWSLDVPAGGKSRVEYEYRLAFSGKQEVAGGNRRE